ncbi:MAG: hypothetical protein Q4D29_12395 [Lachnospiraceae bacterium]|nr:hypothetical protein [Lachnospiraceae bacterium]
MNNIEILDCTLRDGGHVNNSKFGYNTIVDIVSGLSRANVNYVEMGFLINGTFTKDHSSCNDVDEMSSRILAENERETKYTAMIRPDWYDISQLSEEKQKVDIIRFAFYYRDFDLMKKYAEIVRKRNYGVICNPVNIMGYSEDTLKELVARINDLQPMQLTMVDTYGSLTFDALHRIYTIIEENLNSNIKIGLHLHENKSMAMGLLNEFLNIRNKDRKVVIDASLLGMGRMPGNLCIELLVSYLNSVYGTNYNELEIYKLISKYIEPLKREHMWGYDPAYAISAQLNMHRSYAEYLLEKKVTLVDIYRVLNSIPTELRDEFHRDYIEKIILGCR